MYINVDRDLCELNALCVGAAPGVFDIDDDDELVIQTDPVAADDLEAVERAVKICPRSALSTRP